MNIAQRIAEKSNVPAWQPVLERFRVSFRTTVPKKVLFIGESPHTDEVRLACRPEKRYPLAGQSGKRITATLSDIVSSDQRCQAIGKLVASGSVNWLSIINVVEVPLDAAAYQTLIVNGNVNPDPEDASLRITDWVRMMHSFGLIKADPKAKSRRNDFVDDIESCIIGDFCHRLRNAVNEDTELVVLLGEVAKAYYERCDLKQRVNPFYEAHPSPKSMSSGGTTDKSSWNITKELRWELKKVANSGASGSSG